MSRIKDLRNDPENTFNIIDLLGLLMPVKKPKYSELLYNIIKNRSLLSREEFIKKRSEMMTRYNISTEDLEGITPYQLILLSKIAGTIFTNDEWTSIGKFCQYNERGVVERNDLSTYKSMDEIEESVKVAQLKIDMKEMEKYVKKIYEDDEWIVIRPLTYQSALKYGYGTKWCTSSTDKSSYFQDYATRGILIYVMNIKTGHKIAAFRELRKGGEHSYWNSNDDRIDSMDSGLPPFILESIKHEMKNFPKSNNDIRREDELGIKTNQETSKELTTKMIELSQRLTIARREGRSLSGLSGGNTAPPDHPISVRDNSNLARFLLGENLPVNESIPQGYVVGYDPANDNGDVTVMQRIPITNPETGVSEMVTGVSVRTRGEIDPNGMVNPVTIEVTDGGHPHFSPSYIALLNNDRLEE